MFFFFFSSLASALIIDYIVIYARNFSISYLLPTAAAQPIGVTMFNYPMYGSKLVLLLDNA